MITTTTMTNPKKIQNVLSVGMVVQQTPKKALVSVLATTKKNKKIFPKKFLTAPKNSSIVCLA